MTVDILPRKLVLEVVPLVLHSLVGPGNDDALLLAVVAILLHPVEAALLSAELLQLLLEVARILYFVAVAIDGVVLQADIDADGPVDNGKLVGTATVVHEQVSVPFARGHVLDDYSFDFSFDLTMQSDGDVADLAEVQEADLIVLW